jgi:hypothetical protein
MRQHDRVARQDGLDSGFERHARCGKKTLATTGSTEKNDGKRKEGKKDGDKKGFGVETWPVFVGKAVWAQRATPSCSMRY